jgi:hypothetical protein
MSVFRGESTGGQKSTGNGKVVGGLSKWQRAWVRTGRVATPCAVGNEPCLTISVPN